MTQAQTTTTNHSTIPIPMNGTGTININITNPTAVSNPPLPVYPQYNLPYCYPPCYYMPGMQQNSTSIANQSLNEHAISSSSIKETTKPKKEKEIVKLTNEYIMTLENYLRNNERDLRISGIKEVLARFKEDKSRVSNAPLICLLNIALQDKDPTVKTIALSIPMSGYTTGDKKTREILKEIQKSDLAYNQDAIMAAQTMLKLSEQKIKVEDNAYHNEIPPKKEDKKE